LPIKVIALYTSSHIVSGFFTSLPITVTALYTCSHIFSGFFTSLPITVTALYTCPHTLYTCPHIVSGFNQHVMNGSTLTVKSMAKLNARKKCKNSRHNHIIKLKSHISLLCERMLKDD
jgi:hypothetical protein